MNQQALINMVTEILNGLTLQEHLYLDANPNALQPAIDAYVGD